ncbi:hypothetical protein Tco_0923612 [Tanacetum coccineum]|uniref:Uncharacterized protein n=1 Tax=Tanacetum coccineum TaxID=301880 RepID=A0ABQ5D4R9_9ASTR
MDVVLTGEGHINGTRLSKIEVTIEHKLKITSDIKASSKKLIQKDNTDKKINLSGDESESECLDGKDRRQILVRVDSAESFKRQDREYLTYEKKRAMLLHRHNLCSKKNSLHSTNIRIYRNRNHTTKNSTDGNQMMTATEACRKLQA